MDTATLIYFIRPNHLKLFNSFELIVVVCHQRQSWPEQPQQGRIRFWRKKINFILIWFNQEVSSSEPTKEQVTSISPTKGASVTRTQCFMGIWVKDVVNYQTLYADNMKWKPLSCYMRSIWEDNSNPILYGLTRRW